MRGFCGKQIGVNQLVGNEGLVIKRAFEARGAHGPFIELPSHNPVQREKEIPQKPGHSPDVKTGADQNQLINL
jgi:hypothetical protein